MNWYKTAIAVLGPVDPIVQQYQESYENEPYDVNITGPGVNQIISISGQTISARDLINEAVKRIRPLLIQNGVREIDTSPIGRSDAQGLAVSSKPGIVFVDIQKIFNLHRQALPPTAQLDGTEIDPDIIKDIINKIVQSISGEIGETSLHESQHMHDYMSAIQEGQPFSSVQETPAQQFGQQMRSRYFPESFNQ